MKKLLITALLVLSVSIVHAKEYTKHQLQMIEYAKIEGKKLGPKHKGILPAIIRHESNFGKLGRTGDGGDAYGIAQMHIPTALFVIEYAYGIKKEKVDIADLKHRLKTDDIYAIRLARIYIGYLLKRFHGNQNAAILAYNIGPKRFDGTQFSFDPNNYVRKIKEYRRLYA